MSQAWISRCLDRAKDADAMVFNELGCDPAQLTFTAPGCYFSHSLAGGLGWGCRRRSARSSPARTGS